MVEIYSWEQLVERYPNSWVLLRNVLWDGSTVISGELLEVCTDETVDERWLYYAKKGCHPVQEYTAEKSRVGGIYAEHIKYTVE